MSQHTSPSVSPPVHASASPAAGSAGLAAASAAGSSPPLLRAALPLATMRRRPWSATASPSIGTLSVRRTAGAHPSRARHRGRRRRARCSVSMERAASSSCRLVATAIAAAPLRSKPGDGVTLRPVSRGELVRGGLRPQVGSGDFDVVFLRATPDLFTPALLSELRSLLARAATSSSRRAAAKPATSCRTPTPWATSTSSTG